MAVPRSYCLHQENRTIVNTMVRPRKNIGRRMPRLIIAFVKLNSFSQKSANAVELLAIQVPCFQYTTIVFNTDGWQCLCPVSLLGEITVIWFDSTPRKVPLINISYSVELYVASCLAKKSSCLIYRSTSFSSAVKAKSRSAKLNTAGRMINAMAR